MLNRLGDIGSLLADLQHDESCIRRNLVLAVIPTPSIKKTLGDTEVSESLFGNNLDEAFKSAKVMAATTEELRPPQAKNSSKQSKNSKGPLARSKTYQRASQGGQRYYHHQRGSQNQRGSPHRSSRRDHAKRDHHRQSRRYRK